MILGLILLILKITLITLGYKDVIKRAEKYTEDELELKDFKFDVVCLILICLL